MNKTKLGMFYRTNGSKDKFLKDIIEKLSKKYEIKKFEINNYNQLVLGMNWAELCWFEWCDDLFAFASNLEIAENKRIVCRLHSSEAFTSVPFKVNWNNIDGLIVVAKHLLELLPEHLSKDLNTCVIENGVNIEKFGFRNRNKGFNIAFIAGIIPRKNPVLLLQITDKLVKKDRRYKLFVAGEFIDEELKLYWDYALRELNLHNNVIFEGWQSDVNKWLENKNYILSTSIHESFGYNIAEAMVKGIKPVIHNFPYAKEIWDKKYLFNTIDEAVNRITEEQYSSQEYYDVIKERYPLEKQVKTTDEFLDLRLKTPVTKRESHDIQHTISDNMVIFGASTLGKAAYEMYKVSHKIICFCDNDKNKWGKDINGVRIVSPDSLNMLNKDFEVLIASMYYEEIIQQLINIGIEKYKLFTVQVI